MIEKELEAVKSLRTLFLLAPQPPHASSGGAGVTPPPWDGPGGANPPRPSRGGAVDNLTVAEALYEIADLLEFTGGDPFKVRACR